MWTVNEETQHSAKSLVAGAYYKERNIQPSISFHKWTVSKASTKPTKARQRCYGYVMANQVLCSFYPLMHNLLGFQVISRSSTAVNHIVTDLVGGEVLVEFKNGESYAYTNVSRRAILNLLLQPNLSLGFWVNENLLYCGAKCATYGSCEHLKFAV